MDLSTREGRRQQGERIKLAAKEAGLTLDELARKIGCSRALIFQYASGASLPQSDRLQQISQAVGRPLYWFFTESGDPSEGVPPDSGKDSLAAERSRLDTERELIAIERSSLELRRIREDVAHMEALLAAVGSPVDYRKVAECCQQLQQLLVIEMREDPDRLASVLFQHGNALIRLQEWGAAKEKLEQAAAHYMRAEKPVLARDCTQSLGHANLMLGRVEEARRQFEFVAASEDWTNRWQGALSIGAAHEMSGNYTDAIASFEAALAVVDEQSSDATTRSDAKTDVARLYIEANWANVEIDFGDYLHAIARSEKCVHLAQRHGEQDQYVEALLTGGVANLHLGRIGRSKTMLQQAMDVAQLTGDRQHHALALSCLALCEVNSRRAPQAILHGKEALAIALRCNAMRAEVFAQRALSECYLLSASPAEALYHADQGLIVGANLFGPRMQLTVLKAKALMASGDAASATRIAAETLRLVEETQVRPVVFDCRMLLARLELAAGNGAAALKYAESAMESARSMQLQHELWRCQAVAGLAMLKRKGRTGAKAALGLAADMLAQARPLDDTDYESYIMEDPLAMELWMARLALIAKEDGAAAACDLAEQTEWPPLIEWASSGGNYE